MRLGLLIAFAALAAGGCGAGGDLFRQYEYEEEMYLSLDGTATMYVNSSIAALNALRGTTFDVRPNARVDTAGVRQYYSSPITRVVRVTTSRRRGRRYVHVRLEVDDLRRLGEAVPFSWSTYQLTQAGDVVTYRQTIGDGAGAAPELQLGPPSPTTNPTKDPTTNQTTAGWAGDEMVAFRIHIPSVVVFHNAGPENLRRGNILVWEQPLAERLKGTPLELEARMEPQSILYRTLLLFGAMIAGVGLLFALVIWRIVRRGRNLKSES